MALDHDVTRPVAFIEVEGGEWRKWSTRKEYGDYIHAVLFADGHVFDLINGWRSVQSGDRYQRWADQFTEQGE